MNDELNNDLKKRISEVFDNYQDTDVDAGWMLLREKFPAPAKHRGTAKLWWVSAAAVFLLCLGLGIWLRVKDNDKPKLMANRVDNRNKPELNSDTMSAISETHTGDLPDVNKPLTAPGTKNGTYAGRFVPQKPSLNESTDIALAQKQAVTAAKRGAAENNYATDSRMASTVNRGKKDSMISTPRPQPAQQYATVVVPDVTPGQDAKQTTPSPVVQTPAKRSISALFEEDYARNSKKQPQKANDKNVHFGVYAATYVNYAKGSDNQVNVGAGVTSDFRISKNLKLSTGVAIAQNSFNYAVDNTAELPLMAAEASVIANSVKATNDKALTNLIAEPSLQNYNARLIGLDVPVNLKYEFNPEKSDTYISAGLSSGTFLNQSYNYKFNYSSLSKEDNQVVNEKIQQGIGDFYFAKTLNIAFGVGYPLGKHNRLVIEPFVKYPLDGLGAQQIKFGAGGINLKLNFQTRKK